MGMFTEEPMFEDPNLPAGWYRKVVQRQTGATAGQWDVYVYNPDGKKFRSRNELRSYFQQTGSSMCSEDFDFSVKGKGGHHTPGAGKDDYVTKNWEDPTELYGISKYGRDSYDIFCRGQWKKSQPTDIMLRLYQDWIWTNRRVLRLDHDP